MMRAHSAADAALDSDGQSDFELSAGHVMEPCGVIDELIHRSSDEIDKHDLDDGTKSRCRRADGESRDRAFADRCIDDPVFAKCFRQSVGYPERPAESNVFPEKIERWVAAHLLV